MGISDARCRHCAFQNPFDKTFVERQKETCHGTDQRGTDDRSDAEDPAEQPSGRDEARIGKDPNDTEFFVQFVADHDRHEVVRTCPCIGLDNDGHAESKDHAAERKNTDAEKQTAICTRPCVRKFQGTAAERLR